MKDEKKEVGLKSQTSWGALKHTQEQKECQHLPGGQLPRALLLPLQTCYSSFNDIEYACLFLLIHLNQANIAFKWLIVLGIQNYLGIHYAHFCYWKNSFSPSSLYIEVQLFWCILCFLY